MGKYNLSNVLVVVVVGRLLGLEFFIIILAIVFFEGVYCCFEYRGECNGIVFVDDYVYYFSEINVILVAVNL